MIPTIRERVREWERNARDDAGMNPHEVARLEMRSYFLGRADALKAVLTLFQHLEEEDRIDRVLQAFEADRKGQ